MGLRHSDCSTTTAATDTTESPEVIAETTTMPPEDCSETLKPTDSVSASSGTTLTEEKAKDNRSLFFEVIKVRKKTDVESSRTIVEKALELQEVRDRSRGTIALNEDFSPENLNNLLSSTFEATSKSDNTSSDSSQSPHIIKELAEKVENLTAAPLIGEQPPFPFPGKSKLKLGEPVVLPYQGCPDFCQANQHSIGTCLSSEDCYQRGGSSSGPCCGGFFVCCHCKTFGHLLGF